MVAEIALGGKDVEERAGFDEVAGSARGESGEVDELEDTVRGQVEVMHAGEEFRERVPDDAAESCAGLAVREKVLCRFPALELAFAIDLGAPVLESGVNLLVGTEEENGGRFLAGA